MRNPTDSSYFQSGREDSNLRPLDPQSSDSSLSVRNCILPPPPETAGNRQGTPAIGSRIQTSAEFKKAYQEERLNRTMPWRLAGYRLDPATAAAWGKEASELLESVADRDKADIERALFGDPERDTEPCPTYGLVGQKFGKLTVVEETPGRNNGSICFCDCDCGTKLKRVIASDLRKKHVRSCGCLRRNKKAVAA